MELLHKSGDGYLFVCRCRRAFKLAFGTFAISIGKHQLCSLQKEVEFQLIHWKDRVHPGEKAFFFSTDSPQVNLLMNYQDMQALHELISRGMLVMKAQDLVLASGEDDETMSND